ncbi:hypothetical protein MM221_11410 [Salipaludibacillus sp. LMS25]|jgi:hypothetical protein|uniref:hypothetical protein n=1 Tax=Salipaludibacillus sp. LMS25 TaxID=2924031 RepID=UPI0020D0C87C|nr:hypothetical protein [Salipaludibacillus sp. LMS25]UTR13255.1 hypothetical protein MM221_11410 [Salipaludibacillus sp. LMS25]
MILTEPALFIGDSNVDIKAGQEEEGLTAEFQLKPDLYFKTGNLSSLSFKVSKSS